MTINKALKHFQWKFENVWKATEDDLEAYNTFVEFTELQLNKQYNDNKLFAKLYIAFYGEILKYYRADVFDNRPQNSINRILDTPIEDLIKKFIDKATDVEQAKEFTINGVLKHPLQLTEQQKEDVKIIEPVLTYEEAEDNFINSINMALTKYK